MSNIAIIGLGNMGGPMAANLIKAGHKVTGFDLVKASCDAAKADGVAIAASAVEAVKSADVVITMLPAGKHVLTVWTEIVPAVRDGALLIDSSTIDVDSARKAHWSCGGAQTAVDRCAGLGRRRRRQGRDAHLHVRRHQRCIRRGEARARGDGQAHRPLRRRRRRAGGENLQQHDPCDFHDRRQRGVRAGRKTRPVAPGAVRRGVHVVRPVLGDHQLLPGAGTCAGVTRQQRLQAGLRRGA